jgi:ATP-independent RNA helicase DbpA
MTETNLFESLKLRSELLENLRTLNYHQMTLIQEKSLPPILSGRDIIGRAKTGSGKTAAFALGALNSIDPDVSRVQALVLCPTRELANQVTQEIRRLARKIPNVRVLTLCGGNPIGPQIGSLEHGVHIVVGTPGRILKHLKKETLRLRSVTMFVLDEADRMLDMGFSEDIENIIEKLPRKRQTLLFSATYPDAISQISSRIQDRPLQIDVTDLETPAEIEQHWSSVTRATRLTSLLQAIEYWAGTLNIVFCNTKIDCAEITDHLISHGIAALAMHGDLEQIERTETLIQFSNESATVLVATDVAARGLDIGKVDVVFNYELPKQPEVYIHRIGRTGRAGRKGQAVSLVAEKEQRRLDTILTQPSSNEIIEFDLESAGERSPNLVPSMCTIEINGGRRHKLRPGDFLGAITATKGIPGSAVGKIDVLEDRSYVAVEKVHHSKAVEILNAEPIKGRSFRARATELR